MKKNTKEVKPSNLAKKTARMRSLKHGTGSLILVAAVVAIAVVLNVFVGLLDIKFDMTSNDLYTLTEENKAFLDQVKDVNIEIYGLFDVNSLPDSDYNLIMQLLEDYQNNYKNIKVTYFDPDRNPDILTKLDPAGTLDYSTGDLIVVNGDGVDKDGSYYSAKKKVVKAAALFYQDTDATGVVYNYSMRAEQAISGAINYVASNTTPTIYFLTGHGELDFKESFTYMVEQLDYSNYAIEALDLVSVSQVPEDAAIVLVVNPQQDISTDEKVKLNDYLKSNKGKMIVICEAASKGVEYNNLQSVLSGYNLSMNNDLISEAQKYWVVEYNYATVFKTSPNQDDEILTNSNIGEYQLIMGACRSVRFLSNYNQSLNQFELLSTSASATTQAMVEGQSGSNGRMMMGAAVSAANGSRVALFGSSTFISDFVCENYMANWMVGAVVFKSVVEWMVPVENTINIQAKVIHVDNNLYVSNIDVILIGVVCVIVVPLVIIGAGVVVWMKRRNM